MRFIILYTSHVDSAGALLFYYIIILSSRARLDVLGIWYTPIVHRACCICTIRRWDTTATWSRPIAWWIPDGYWSLPTLVCRSSKKIAKIFRIIFSNTTSDFKRTTKLIASVKVCLHRPQCSTYVQYTVIMRFIILEWTTFYVWNNVRII